MAWWNSEVIALLRQVLVNQQTIIANQKKEAVIMSAISDAVATLKTKLDSEGVEIGVLTTFVQTLNQEIKDALANAADAEAAVTAITSLSAEVDGQVQQLKSAEPPPAPGP